jgi:hypothetical protein
MLHKVTEKPYVTIYSTYSLIFLSFLGVSHDLEKHSMPFLPLLQPRVLLLVLISELSNINI